MTASRFLRRLVARWRKLSREQLIRRNSDLVELAQILPVVSSELPSGSSVATAAGEITCTNVVGLESMRRPSVSARTANFVRAVDGAARPKTLKPATEAMLMIGHFCFCMTEALRPPHIRGP